MSEKPDTEPDEEERFVLCSDPLPERRGRKVDPDARRFNVALHRICKGKYPIGGVCHELSVLTGISEEGIRDRIARVEWEYPPEELEPETGWTSDDRKYFGKRYGRLKDPAVREFLQGLAGGNRKHPDHEDARVARRRINGRLTSESIGVKN